MERGLNVIYKQIVANLKSQELVYEGNYFFETSIYSLVMAYHSFHAYMYLFKNPTLYTKTLT
jgi:hypothetical protein